MKDWNTCCYIYRIEIDKLQITFNNMWKATHGSNYTYNYQIYGSTTTNPIGTNPTSCCRANVVIFSIVTQMWESIVYKKGEFMQWHKWECLLGECDKCDVNLLPLRAKEIERFDNHVVAWRQFFLE
jgi:hypothetical protein